LCAHTLVAIGEALSCNYGNQRWVMGIFMPMMATGDSLTDVSDYSFLSSCLMQLVSNPKVHKLFETTVSSFCQ